MAGNRESECEPTTFKDKILIQAKEGRNEATDTLALTLASEPASWYYAIPYFSKNHTPTIAHLNSKAAKVSSMVLVAISLIILATLSYYLLLDFSELLAIITCSLFLYGIVFCVANYRAAKNYSIYIQDDHLVITKGLIGIIRVPLKHIKDVKINVDVESNDLVLGKKSEDNAKLIFNQPQYMVRPVIATRVKNNELICANIFRVFLRPSLVSAL
ncbi:hypothetical protein [Parashewanella tropica]|uniref:hypothetical protein n=1 Tax=Parashewanella tropica TaxID=2547970 RepID=UPI001059C0E6|nr:hypothetical protein [Parashewanella tropica]